MEESRRWDGKWIWTDGAGRQAALHECETVLFRRSFHVPERTKCRLVFDVSADSRYKLYFNGKLVGNGPCKGDGNTFYYETYDLTESLRSGTNVLAVQVVHYPVIGANIAAESIWRSPLGAFYLEGMLTAMDGEVLALLHSDQRWRVKKEVSVRFVHETWMSSKWLAGVEKVDGTLFPHGWNQVGYDDRDWHDAELVMEPINSFGLLTPWQLTKRPIPMLESRERTFYKVVREEAVPGISAAESAFLFCSRSPAALQIPPGSRYMIELDAGLLTTGYIKLALTGGRGSVIRIQPSECYELPPQNGRRMKERRDDPSGGKRLLGDTDEYVVSGRFLPGGEEKERYEPFWWKTFRFVRLEIHTGEQPLWLHSFHYVETAYPLRVAAAFECSDASLTPLWEVSLHTLRHCMHETYEDCPYYEQLQYTMDTMLQCLYTYYVSADDRLARKAIFDFHSSLLPTGMLRSRYPANRTQIIPGFSLYWIYMLHDHFRFFADLEFVKRFRPTVEAVLDWFERRRDKDGLVGPSPEGYWSFVDWTQEWRAQHGVPAGGKPVPLTVYNLMYGAALKQAADLFEATGRSDASYEFRCRADSVLEAVKRHCWSEQRQLYRDAPDTEQFSQHAQLWAIMAEAPGQGAELLQRCLEDKTLIQASYAMSFFLFRAMSRLERYDSAYPLWDTWKQMLALGLTTWMEDPVSQRSDCHAWGAVPLYEFPAEILGVKPALPGYETILVEPRCGPLRSASGKVPTVKGEVTVSWHIDDGLFRIQVDGPSEVPLIVRLPDRSEARFASSRKVNTECPWKEQPKP
ncbi:hypothetical protein PAESOLCIP111_02109 [Paenibacillus solanacearum]|uniref:Alpha-L-rhamnosidase n=1 Tax=Paenibacillus solanacearum TaxID=2048548 RepID=A0A916K0A6_9BACL|nr:alpha-L-rhamnosidase C-terminal domain-containing protein [Paenibacillus solanacearum]CAG7618377.1 hypothetical protein PAESOLCIP111_02109 [Paenibacillus solanacearum]